MYRIVTRRRGLLRNESTLSVRPRKTTSRTGHRNTPSTGARAITNRAAANHWHVPRQRDARVLRLHAWPETQDAQVDSVQTSRERTSLGACVRMIGAMVQHHVHGLGTRSRRWIWPDGKRSRRVVRGYRGGRGGRRIRDLWPDVSRGVQFQQDGGGTRTTLSPD